MIGRHYSILNQASEFKNINNAPIKPCLHILPVQTNIGGTEAQTNINLQKTNKLL